MVYVCDIAHVNIVRLYTTKEDCKICCMCKLYNIAQVNITFTFQRGLLSYPVDEWKPACLPI